MKRAVYCHFHTNSLLVKLMPFLTEMLKFSCPRLNVHQHRSWPCTTLWRWHQFALPSLIKNFSNVFKTTKSWNSQPPFPSSLFLQQLVFWSFFKNLHLTLTLSWCARASTAQLTPMEPVLIQWPQSASCRALDLLSFAEVGSEQNLLCHSLYFGQDGWWQWNCCT